MDWGLALGVVSVIGIPLALGLTMPASSRGEFRFTRGCFLLSAILMGGSAAMLHSLNEQPLWLRVSMAAVVGAFALGGLVYALDWVTKKETAVLGPKAGADL